MQSYLMSGLTWLFLCAILFSSNAAYPSPGDITRGEVWPLPWQINYYNVTHNLATTFSFTTKQKCEILDKAFARYTNLMFPHGSEQNDDNQQEETTLTGVNVIVTSACATDVPQFGMDESYKLEVPAIKGGQATLKANEVWGALRGLETLSQLMFYPDKGVYRMRAASIRDHPRFPHRGVLLDTSRHFMPVQTIKDNIELMAQNKFNVFHWHIVDDPAFPYESKVFPKLSKLGAYSARHVYSQNDIKDIIEFAKLRGVRVMAEFDTPGHTTSWGKGQRAVVCDCYSKPGKRKNERTLIDPTKESTWDFLLALFTEILTVFPDHYIHLGGDEVGYWIKECWLYNPRIYKFMQIYGFGKDTTKLENYYFQNFLRIIDRARHGAKFVVWQEVLDRQIHATQAIAHVWKGNTRAAQMREMATVTGNGHYAILSSCWYLNMFSYGSDFKNYYDCDPQAFKGTESQKRKVLGGEAAMWGEMVDASNVLPRLWPRASAVAERLWSDPEQTTHVDVAWPRMHEMRCRMVHRGYPAQPINGPSFCPYPYQ